jgi:hypothetical protein
MRGESGPCLDDNFKKCSLDISSDILDNESADEYCIMTNQISETDYSKEFEDILALMARRAISIESLVDPLLRKDVEETVQHSNDITWYDRAAALQLTSRIEVDDKFLVHSPDRMQLLQQRIIEGPLTENHFLVLKLLCVSEVHDTSTAVNEDKAPVSPELVIQQAIQSTINSDSKITEDKVSCDNPLLDVLMLLKNCDLEPSYLMQNESRKLIEDNLSNRQGPLPAQHLAVMQLISKAEIESGLSMDTMRKSLLEKRIKEGPLNATHLNAVLSLGQVEGGNLPKMGPIVPAQAGEVDQLNAAGLDHQVKQHESFEVQNIVGDVAAGYGALAHVIRVPFFIDTISGLEVKTSLLSREEKSALQLMELRAKTARIRQSLPEWVKNGLVPPRLRVIRKPSPPAAAMAESLANVSDQNDAGKGAVQISCNVQADLGFLNDLVPTAAKARFQQNAMESLFLNVEKNDNIATDEPQPVPGWQVGPLEEEVLGPGLSPTPPSRIGSSLAWLSSHLSQCLSTCLRAMLGGCSSGLGCLICLVKRPGAGNQT